MLRMTIGIVGLVASVVTVYTGFVPPPAGSVLRGFPALVLSAALFAMLLLEWRERRRD